jgi:GGDEF domain-containing protein
MRHDCFKTFPSAERVGCNPAGDELYLIETLDPVLRNYMAQLSEEERIRLVFYRDVTGLPNARAYKLAHKKVVQVVFDMDGLKWANDNLGDCAGDAMLRQVGHFVRLADIDCYHVKGDTFYAQFDEVIDAQYRMLLLQRVLLKAIVRVDDGRRNSACWQGIGITYGAGYSLLLAERVMHRQKEMRLEKGLRADRGSRPPYLKEITEQ